MNYNDAIEKHLDNIFAVLFVKKFVIICISNHNS